MGQIEPSVLGGEGEVFAGSFDTDLACEMTAFKGAVDGGGDWVAIAERGEQKKCFAIEAPATAPMMRFQFRRVKMPARPVDLSGALGIAGGDEGSPGGRSWSVRFWAVTADVAVGRRFAFSCWLWGRSDRWMGVSGSVRRKDDRCRSGVTIALTTQGKTRCRSFAPMSGSWAWGFRGRAGGEVRFDTGWTQGRLALDGFGVGAEDGTQAG